MTNFRIEHLPFDQGALQVWAQTDERNNNWPVVYTISADNKIYVGETLNVANRLQQHLASAGRKDLRRVRIVFNDTFNKSVCLDLESHLIRYLHADGAFEVLNRNHGIVDADYYNRDEYRRDFDALFEELLKEGLLTRTIPEIVNSNLFKYSPFKALTPDQAVAVESILDIVFDNINRGLGQSLVVQGDPGTGKTIVAIYVMKLLRDIVTSEADDLLDQDTLFSGYFDERFRGLLKDFRIGLVIPQQSLRKTVQTVFAKTPGLSRDMVLNAFDVGESELPFDLLIVDEAHRLGIRSNQPSAVLNKKFSDINLKLFGEDRDEITQLDWIKAQSRHQVFLLDTAQSVKPADLPKSVLEEMIRDAKDSGNHVPLTSQMRVGGGSDYIDFVARVMAGTQEEPESFGDYDLRFFDDLGEMRDEILRKNEELGLCRLVAGYAWPWVSKYDPNTHDFVIDEIPLTWNRTITDWINSETSIEEVGSIHTVQGYDLNYAGVIIGPDIGFDPATKQIVFYRENYHDKKGKENNKRLGIEYTDDDLKEYVLNIYRVLLTRGIRGTFVYACDPNLKNYLGPIVPTVS